jgi:hypothetical protein
MTSCKRCQCIYVADWWNKVIYKFDKSSGKLTRWSVEHTPDGLSVNVDYNVVVTFQTARKINVFTTRGQLLKEVNLQQSGVVRPWHTIQLTTDHYLVSHGDAGDPVSRISVVDDKGQVRRSFGGAPGSSDKELNTPYRLATLKDGSVLVSDFRNKRLLQLSPTLNYSRILLRFNGTPYRLWFDDLTAKLYVGLWDGGFEVYAVSCSSVDGTKQHAVVG